MNEKIKKPTLRSQYVECLDYLPDHLREFINGRIAQLDKKNVSGGDKKMTKEQVAKAELAESLLEMMEPNMLYTVSQLQKMHPDMAEFSNQKAYGVIRILKDEGKVERIEDKRKAFFRKVC